MAQLIVRNKLGGEAEVHTWQGSLLDFLRAAAPNYRPLCRPPYSATLNGKPWPYRDHGDVLRDEDRVDITIEPGDPATVFAVIAVIASGYAYIKSTSIPQNYQTSTPSGRSIYAANGKANSTRVNGVIREVTGDVPIYPDLICPVRRKYRNNVEYLYVNLCVGVGYFDGDINNLYIDQTPVSNYAGDVSAQLTEPGNDVSGHEAHENWYTTNEVLDLALSTESDGLYDMGGDWSYDASGQTMTFYKDGIPTTVPFGIDTVFRLQADHNSGYYRVDSISGTSNETAVVVYQDVTINFEGGEIDPSRDYEMEFSDASSTSLVTVSGEDAYIESQGGAGAINIEGPFEVIPSGESTDRIEVDVNFPRGLAEIISDGSLSSRTVSIDIEYRDVGTSSWTTISKTYTAASLDELGFTEVIDLGNPIRPEVRFTRVSPESNTTDIVDEVVIKRVKGLLDTPVSYPDVTTLQLRLRGTNALASTAENRINLRGLIRKLPTLAALQAYLQNGTPYTLTSDHGGSNLMAYAAWMIYDVSGEDIVNWGAFAAIDTILKSRGDDLNVEFSDESTVWQALKIILAPAYAEASIREGLLTPVRREASSAYQQFYTPDVMLSSGLSRDDTHYASSEPKGIIVEYLNPVTGINETVNCFLPGDDEAKAKRIQATGITNRIRAWRYGMRERRRLAYKPAKITFTTELDALNSDYGNYDAVASPLNANQSFYVTDYSAPTVTLDGIPDLAGPDTYYAAFRKPNGAFSGHYIVTAGPNSQSVTLSSPATLDFTPVYDGSMEDTICVIGTFDELVERIWIDSISPSSNNTVKVTGEEYIAAIFADDNNSPS